MADRLCSIGLDVGTTTTQLIVSELIIENQASTFSVPEMQITKRKILYESPVHFTPLLQGELVDGDEIRKIVLQEYQNAGITRTQVDTGAVIITGETSRKENAQTVLHALSDFAGDFVVATAGPDLESILAAKGAGATEFSQVTGQKVLHMDIGGGTSNFAWIEDGRILATGCMNIGGRLLKLDETGHIRYISPVLQGLFTGKIGEIPSIPQLEAFAKHLITGLEMAAGLRERTNLMDKLWTKEAGSAWPNFSPGWVISFSGGVADCIEKDLPPLSFGDIGPVLGKAIRESRLCQGAYRLGTQTIRATVIGAGSHSTQLSGSTVFHQNIGFPLKNLPVITHIRQLQQLESPAVLAIQMPKPIHYAAITDLADSLAAHWPAFPILIASESDMAKALGHALALRTPKNRAILCIDRVKLEEGCYLDVGAPISTALPVVVKTLILSR